jgi:transcriptional regulator with GAF, ATPase, and Fis domain
LKYNLRNFPLITKDTSILLSLKDLKYLDDFSILITGETGVGKTSVAIYANKIISRRRPFVRVNCSHLSYERFIDDMFGHVKGAYTGCVRDKKGLVELANGGDLFLDEIGDLSLRCQASFLTFFDTGEYRKFGEEKIRFSDCRIICATNKNLFKMTSEGKFRKDLLSRISQYIIEVPPLRKRKEDIKKILKYYFKKFKVNEEFLSTKTKRNLEEHDFMEGNIRELKSIIKYFSKTNKIKKQKFLKSFKTSTLSKINDFKQNVYDMGYKTYIKNIEKEVLINILKEEKSIRSMAKKLSINHTTLLRKLRKLKSSV